MVMLQLSKLKISKSLLLVDVPNTCWLIW